MFLKELVMTSVSSQRTHYDKFHYGKVEGAV